MYTVSTCMKKPSQQKKRLHVQLFCFEPYALHPSSFTATHITVVLSSNVILCIHKVGNIFSREYKKHGCCCILKPNYGSYLFGCSHHRYYTTTTIHYGGSSVESMNGYSMNAVYNITTVFVYYHRTSISVWFIHKHITANLRPKINYLFICSETNPIYAIGS